MTELLTAAQMRTIEQAAIASGKVTGLELMERAGKAVVEAILAKWPLYRDAPQSVLVLCGPGNNGGDGFVVARLLKDLDWDVRVLFLGALDQLPPDARINHDLWLAFGDIEPLTEKNLRRLPAMLYVDAVFGTGLSRPLDGDAWAVISHMAGRNGDTFNDRTISIDAPSGLCLDSGRVLGPAGGAFRPDPGPFAKLTVTFDSPKRGHFLADGPQLCGELVVSDIGLAQWRAGADSDLRPALTTLVTRHPVVADRRRFLNRDFWFRFLNKPEHGTHKYTHGHALILSGPSGQTGAARLAARGALRIGAGLVTIGCPPDALAEQGAQLTAIMLKPNAIPADLTHILTDRRINALCLGPGMGVSASTRAMVAAALAARAPAPGPDGTKGPGKGPGLRCIVLDADALTSFADNPADLFALCSDNTVLTPHGGEFARLFPDLAEKLAAPATKGPACSKVDATRKAAARAGCVVLFKGPDTVIAAPDGRCAVHAAQYDRTAPWLATAGSGDVLAGFITGLMARGFPPVQAAETAVWLHVECARSFGPGLIAEDLPEALPKVFRVLGG